MRIDEAIPQYLTHLHSVARRSPATITAYRHDLARFVSFLGADASSPLADITPPLIEAWIASMRHLSTSTVRRALNALSALNEDELEGVLAHELSHVRNRDMLIGTLAATMAGALMILARIGMFAGMFAGDGRYRRGGGLGVILLAIFGVVAAGSYMETAVQQSGSSQRTDNTAMSGSLESALSLA